MKEEKIGEYLARSKERERMINIEQEKEIFELMMRKY